MSIKVDVSDCRAGGEPKVFEKGKNVVARVSVAHSEQVADDSGAVRPATRWLQVVGFGEEAKFIKENVHTGSRLEIEGAELHYGRPYVGKDGQSHTPDELHVIPGKGSIYLKEVAGNRADQGDGRKLEA